MNVFELINGSNNATGSILDNKEHKTDYGANDKLIHDIVKSDLENQYRVDSKEYDKYSKYGINYTPERASNGSLDRMLADAQSNWEKFGNALAQTVVSEIGLGTAIAFSDMFDAIGQAIGASDHDYSNPISNKLEEWQEQFRNEVAPIYSRPGSGFGNGTDFGWWMQNIPSIASSLTLLIPSNLAVGAVSKLGKLAKGTRLANKWGNIGKTTRQAVSEGSKILLNAGIQRTLENYQEARQTYNQAVPEFKEELDKKIEDGTYEDFIANNAQRLQGVDTSDTLEVAKAIARIAADRTFAFDYRNAIFDVIQLAAIRNVSFNAFSKTPKTVRGRRYDINSRKFAGKYQTKEELDALLKNRKTWEKAKDKIGDIGYYLATKGLTESTEGVEEAINYIATQEGLHLGRSILGMEVTTGGFSNRLNDYMRNPELWESAFWGVAGGVMFNIGAGAGSKAQTAAKRRKLDKELNAVVNTTTGENTSFYDTWNKYTETADDYRLKTSIETRIANEADFYTKMTNLNTKNEDPFATGRIIDSDEEKEVLRKQLLEQRRNKHILNAMDSGTIDMLESYLQDKNVQQAMVDAGLIKQEDIAKIESEDLAAIEKIKTQYNAYKDLILKEANNIAKDKGIDIPVEYLQIIVRNNIEHKLNLNNFEDMLRRFEDEANTLKETLGDKVDKDIDYKSVIKLQWLTTKLGELQAEKTYISNDVALKSTISGQERLRQLDNDINSVKNLIFNLKPDEGVANLLLAIEGSYATKMDEKGKFVEDTTNPDLITFRKAINEDNRAYFKNIDNRLVNISDAQMNQRQVGEDRLIKALGTRSDRSISKISKELGTSYASIAALEYNIATETSKLKLTSDEILHEARNLHNYLNEIRRLKIDESFEDIKDLAGIYGSDTIAQYINTYLHKPNVVNTIPNIKEEDAETLKRALNILNLSAPINKNIEEDIYKILEDYDDISAAQRKFSSTSENPISAAQNPKPNGNPQQPKETLRGGQNGANQLSNGQQPIPTAKTQTPANNNNESGLNISGIRDGAVVSNNNTQNNSYSYTMDMSGIYTVHFNTDDNTNEIHYNNTKLFAQEDGVSIMDNNFIIKQNPQINGTGKVVRVGILSTKNDENNRKAIYNSNEDSIDNSNQHNPNLLTGEEDSDNNPIDAEDVSEEEYNRKRMSIDMANDVNSIIMDIAGQEAPIVDDNVLKSIRNTLTDKYNKNNDDYINQMIEQNVQNAKAIAEEYDLYKPVGNAIDAALKHSSISETDIEAKRAASAILNKAIDELVDANKTRLGFEDIDGKTYVNVESLLRFCNKVAHNDAAAQVLYEASLDYLQKSSKYVVVDNNPKSILQNVTLDRNTRENLERMESYSINFDGLCKNELFEEARKKTIKEIDNLNIGDSVSYRKEGNIINFYRNDQKIGYLPIPNNFKQETDHLMQINDGWITDVKPIGNTVESELKDLFTKWIENPDKDSDVSELYNIVLQYAYETDSVKKDELYNKFINNKTYKQALQEGYVDDTNLGIDQDGDAIRLEGLAKLWRYVKDIPYLGEDKDLRNRAEEENILTRSVGIDNWFTNMVVPSFNFAIKLGHSEQGNLTVANITEGSRIETTPEEATAPKSALGERYKREDGTINPSKVKVGVTVRDKTTISGNVNTDNTALISRQLVGSGNTFVVLLGRNNSHDIVHAFPQKATSPSVSRTAQKFVDAAINEITKLIENIDNATTDKRSEIGQLGNFLYNLFGNSNYSQKRKRWYNNYDGLFAPISGNLVVEPVVTNGDLIGYNVFSTNADGTTNGNYFIGLYNNNVTITRTVDGVSESVDIKSAINNILSGNAYFNIGAGFLEIDNNKPSNNSIFSIDENTGKFTVKIGSFVKQYESYNDFILNESLVTLSTKPSTDGFGNHERFGENGGPIQTIKVKDDVAQHISTSPVREMNDKFTITPESIVDIVNSNSKNKGFAIAKLLNNNIKNNVKFNNFYAKLFPKNVIFVNEIIGDLAYANTKDHPIKLNRGGGIIIPEGAIVIGKEWLDELVNSSEAGRKEAIRKLVHEQLHLTLSNPSNEHYVEDIREIFNEFAKNNKDEKATKYLFKSKQEYIDRYYNEDGTINREGLEEFLVESLTSGTLANALNNIQSSNKEEHKSLFSKIIDFLVKLFDWTGVDKINKGSLYEEELSIINGIFGNNKKTTPKKQQTSTEVKTPNVDPNQLSISFNEEVEDVETKTEENTQVEEENESEFAENYEDDDDIPASSIKETSIEEVDVPNITEFVNQFSISEQPSIIRRINDGEISIKCI